MHALAQYLTSTVLRQLSLQGYTGVSAVCRAVPSAVPSAACRLPSAVSFAPQVLGGSSSGILSCWCLMDQDGTRCQEAGTELNADGTAVRLGSCLNCTGVLERWCSWRAWPVAKGPGSCRAVL